MTPKELAKRYAEEKVPEAIFGSAGSMNCISAFLAGYATASENNEHIQDNWNDVVKMARDIIVAHVATMRVEGDINGAALKQAQQFYDYVAAIERRSKQESDDPKN